MRRKRSGLLPSAAAAALLALVAVFTPALECVQSLPLPPVTVTVSSSAQLLAALQDSSSQHVRLAAGLLTLDTAAAAAAAPIVIGAGKALFISGTSLPIPPELLASAAANGSVLPPRYYASVLDLRDFAALLQLGANTMLVISDVKLQRHMSRLGFDQPFAAVAQGATNVTIAFQRVLRVRSACLPLQIFVQHVTSYTRPTTAPGQQQATLEGPACFASGSAPLNVTCVPEALVVRDLATNISRPAGAYANPNAASTINNFAQSFTLVESGPGLYYCERYASMDCLTVDGPEKCINQMIGDSGAMAPAPEEKSNPLTDVLLPALLTGLVAITLIAAAAWWLRRRERAKRAEADEEAQRMAGEATGGSKNGLPRGVNPVVSKEALERIAQVRQELSSKVVSASSSDDLSDVRVLQLIGQGTFGRVYKGDWKGVTVAMKVISMPVAQYGQQQWQQLLGEAAISTLLNHPNIVQTYAVALLEYSPKSNSTGGPVSGGSDASPSAIQPAAAADGMASQAAAPTLEPFYQLKMVSEYCEGGNVRSALAKMRFYQAVEGRVRLPVVADIALQVASAMVYLHSAGIVHADLKAANVLLKQQPGSGRLLAKVADFGLSFRLDPEATHVTRRNMGTITHMSPEALLLGKVSKASDVYAFAVLLYELYTGQLAYEGVPAAMLAHYVATEGGRPTFPTDCPADFRALARACWATDPSIRPTFPEILMQLQEMSVALGTSQGGYGSHAGGARQGDTSFKGRTALAMAAVAAGGVGVVAPAVPVGAAHEAQLPEAGAGPAQPRQADAAMMQHAAGEAAALQADGTAELQVRPSDVRIDSIPSGGGGTGGAGR